MDIMYKRLLVAPIIIALVLAVLIWLLFNMEHSLLLLVLFMAVALMSPMLGLRIAGIIFPDKKYDHKHKK